MVISSALPVIDLFSGAGGMSYGFSKNKAFQIIAAVDFEIGKPGMGRSGRPSRISCNETYEQNIGVKPIAADLSQLSPRELRLSVGLKKHDLGVLISCAPCTGFSQKLARNHLNDDPRNSLVIRSADFVEEFMPEFFVMENVKELLTGKQRHHSRTLFLRLQDLGYQVLAKVHDLSDFGLPQKRRRALVIARKAGKMLYGLQPNTLKPKSVRSAIGHLPPLENGRQDEYDAMHVCPTLTGPVLTRLRAIPRDGGSWRDLIPSNFDLLTPSMKRSDRRSGSFPDIYGRMAWDKPAITITRECASPGNGRYCHPDQDRLLSVREMALLQGFPPNYDFIGRLNAKYNQVGDAVPPLISSQIAEAIRSMQEGLRPLGAPIPLLENVPA